MKMLSIVAGLLLTAVALAEDPASFTVGSLSFQRPAEWQWVAVNSPMRKAQLKVPGKDGKGADIVFFHFGPGMGGDAKSNADRWLRQFESPEGAAKVEKQDFGATKGTLVSTEGTYHSGMPGGPTEALPDQALLGAILENEDGDVFVKMTGPAEVVKSARTQFLDFLKSAATKK